MNILIVGGSGFVSGTLARTALAAGHGVWAVTRGQRPVAEGVAAIAADRKDRAAFAARIREADIVWDLVVDCIGFVAEDARQDIEVFRDCARHLVFISTDFVIDPRRRVFPQGEDAAGYLESGYGHDKRQCELVFAGAETGDMVWTILRPCHIYGPGSLLGCLPLHSRDSQLVERMKAGEPLRLVGGGHFLQQPIFAPDLAELILSCAGNPAAHGQIFMAAGPEIIESAAYYRIIAELLGLTVAIEELPVDQYLAEHPDSAPFLCHRIYDLSRIKAAGLAVPGTRVREALSHQLGLVC